MTLRWRPRVAQRASSQWNLAKTFAQAMTMWFVLLGWIPAQIARLEAEHLPAPHFAPPRAVVIAAAWTFILAGAAALRTGAVLAIHGEGTPLPLDTTRKLVVAGLYRRVRNPMAALSLLQGQMAAVIHGSPSVAAYGAAGILIWHFVARPWEERDLAERFGAEYERYQANVRCWVPRLRPWSPDTPESAAAARHPVRSSA